MTGKLRSEEADAGALLAAILQGTWRARDVPRAPPKTPDLTVHTADGTTVVVEVTSVVNERRRSREQAAYERFWADPRLSRDWVVVFQDEPSPQFDRRIPEVAGHLAVMEAFDIHHVGINWLHGRWPVDPEFPLPPPGSEPDVARAALRGLHVELARSPQQRTSPTGGRIELAFVVPPGTDPWRLNTLVGERVMAKHEKLRTAEGDARHLFVWLDASEPEAYLAAVVMEERMPNPTLPPSIDVVWVATRDFPGFKSASIAGVQVQRLLRVTTAAGWQSVPLTDAAAMARSTTMAPA